MGGLNSEGVQFSFANQYSRFESTISIYSYLSICLHSTVLRVVGLGVGGAEVQSMLVAGDDDVLPGYPDVGRVLRGTEEADGIQCHFKLRACANECASHWFYLCGEYVYICEVCACVRCMCEVVLV